jgi:hypothetical protein
LQEIVRRVIVHFKRKTPFALSFLQPGCRGAATVVLTLDDEGEWSFEVSNAGSGAADTIRRALLATRCMMSLTWLRTVKSSGNVASADAKPFVLAGACLFAF